MTTSSTQITSTTNPDTTTSSTNTNGLPLQSYCQCYNFFTYKVDVAYITLST